MNKFIKRSGYCEMVLDGKHKGIALVSIKDRSIVEKYNWVLNKMGYVVAFINKQYIYLHRFLLQTKKGEYGDHKNHNPLDNRRSNIRIVTMSQNSMNSKIQSNNTSGIRGVVYLEKEKYGIGIKGNILYRSEHWRAYIYLNKKKINLGRHKTKEEAIKVRKEAEEKYFGEFKYKSS